MKLDGATVALTGATGFLGSHVALALMEAGARVRGVVRSPEKGAWLAERGLELRRADLADPESLRAAFEGADVVVGNAALAIGRARASWEAFARTNEEGTQNVLQAARAAGVRRLVHVSTLAVYRQLPVLRRIHEDSPRRQRPPAWWDITRLLTRWEYAYSKTLAEERVWEAISEGLPATILRPGPIYGSRDDKLTARYLAAMERPWAFAPTLALPHVHAGDVALAVCAAIARDESAGRAYNLAGPNASPYAVARALKRLMGRGPLLIPFPVPLRARFDDGRAERELGLTLRGIEEGLAEVVASEVVASEVVASEAVASQPS